MAGVSADSDETSLLLHRAAAGDDGAFEQLIARHREFLRRMIDGRIDRRLAPRLDPADVEQETLLRAYRRLPDYLERRPMPFRLWLWKTAHDHLLNLHRDHIGAARRSVSREVPLPENSSLQLARRFLEGAASPSRVLSERERAQQMRVALAGLAEEDREILLLRYVENFTNQEVAALLDLTPGTASKRHGRALLRLHKILTSMGLEPER